MDDTIHGIIETTLNPAFKEGLNNLDREIHGILDAVQAPQVVAETAQTLD